MHSAMTTVQIQYAIIFPFMSTLLSELAPLSALPAIEGGDLDEIAAGVVQHGDG